MFDNDTVTSVTKSIHWLNSTRGFEILQSQMIQDDQCIHKCFRNVGATSTFYMPEWWYEAGSILRTHRSGVTCDPDC